MDRRTILESLVRFEREMDELRTELDSLPWGAAPQLVALRRTHLQNVLRRFLTGNLCTDAVAQWASLVGEREDIAVEGGRHGPAGEAVFVLANPHFTLPLTFATAKYLWSRLK